MLVSLLVKPEMFGLMEVVMDSYCFLVVCIDGKMSLPTKVSWSSTKEMVEDKWHRYPGGT